MQKYVNGELVDMSEAEVLARQVEEEAAANQSTTVPPAVSMFQARAVLMQAGLYEAVDSAMQSTGGVNALAWEYATEVRRDSPLVLAMASQLDLSPEQIDDLFRAAVQITA